MTPDKLKRFDQASNHRYDCGPGFRTRLFGSPGILGSAAGLLVFVDPSVPNDVIELRDAHSGRVLGKIINVGQE